MTSSTTFRAAPADKATDLVGPVAGAASPWPGDRPGGPAAERDRPWWRRLLRPQPPPHQRQRIVLDRVLILLESARTDLSDSGWLQGGWWTASPPPRRAAAPTAERRAAAAPTADRPAGAVCLIGALLRAGTRHGPDAEVGRAIDTVYEALWESRGQPSESGLVLASSPQIRLAKVQTLTRWNDADGRTGAEVRRLLDRAIAQVARNLAALPAARGQ